MWGNANPTLGEWVIGAIMPTCMGNQQSVIP